MPPHNQNWGLRLREADGTARVSFVFRDERDATSKGEEFWHRWTSSTGFLPGEGWHYVAVSYTFGEADSARGWVDGAEVKGDWDMGGQTELGPWADGDEVWIGTSMGGAAGSSFRGRIDEVAIYRTELDQRPVEARWQTSAPKPVAAPVVKLDDLPKDVVRIEILEHGVSDTDALVTDWTNNDSDPSKNTAGVEASWNNVPKTRTESWTEPAFALADIVAKYSPRGVRRDRSIPFLVRMSGAVTLPPGEHRVLIRAMRGGRLSIDGKLLATSDLFPRPTAPSRASDAEAVPDQLAIQLVKDAPLLPPGHSEAMATIKGDGQAHAFVFETFVGGKNLRPELGQPSVSISTGGSPFRLLTCDSQWIEFSEDGWKHYVREQQARIAELAARHRANADELAYWKMRHDLARDEIAKLAPIAIPQTQNSKLKIQNSIDAFVAAKLERANAEPAALTDDASFLRRVTLDTIGLVPTPDELTAFLADASKDKRSQAIGRLLA